MNIKPLGDRVLLKAEVAEEKTKGGLYIPQTAQEKTQTGVVAAIGESEDIQVKVGDKVMHDKYSGTAISVDGEDFLIVNSSDIIAIVE
ncbi:co-chaperone GroES [Spirochaeta dissipatitropha]